MIACVIVLALLCQISSSSSIASLFPPHYSQHFDFFSGLSKVQLTEAILGEEKYTTFGISLWIKLANPEAGGIIFSIDYGTESHYQIPVLTYHLIVSPEGIGSSTFTLQLFAANSEDKQLSLSITPSLDWIFIAISASYEKNSLLFYCNSGGTENFDSKFMKFEVTLLNAILAFGGSFSGRIGDFKIYNDIYNEVSDWKIEYSSSCLGVSCESLFSSISYEKCDLWCGSQTENFFPLVEPSLFSKAPYLTVNINPYLARYLYNYVQRKEWNDYSITGWVQISNCRTQSEFILTITNSPKTLFTIKLKSSNSSSYCDILEAEIYSTDKKNYTYDSVQINGQIYIGNWFFFAATINTASKLLTLYTQNSLNPPSASFPLIKKSVIYTYKAIPLSSESSIYVGGGEKLEVYPGNYADFRIYPGNFIDSTLMQYNNNIFSPAAYLDPYCVSWESIWYCKSCEKGYFIKNGLCKKCHPSCDSCSSDDTEANCLSCASGYYAQPGHPSLCFDYCPIGYTWDSSLNECIGTKGTIANINFDDNLSGSFASSNVFILFGFSNDNYYPKFDFLDPLPANKRGIYVHSGTIQVLSQSSIQKDRLFGSDFTIEMWTIVKLSGYLFHATYYSPHRYYGLDYGPNMITPFGFKIYPTRNLGVEVYKRDGNREEVYSPLAIESISEWNLLSTSLTYDDISQSIKILIVNNKNSFMATASSHYKEIPGFIHMINNGGLSFSGFLYSLAMYNYGKTYDEILQNIGTCSSCSVCPEALNYCLPTCDTKEFVDENGNCQKCPDSCSWICSRAGTCNLCYDDLCYKCTKYEIGTCIQCVENTVLNSGQCECQSGFLKQGSKCVNKCDDDFYLDADTQACISCPENCIKCKDKNFCFICKSNFSPQNGKCQCADGYFADSKNNCLRCDLACLTCSGISSNCTTCTSAMPVFYDKNKCFSCDSFEGYSKNYGIAISYFTDDLVEKLSKNCVEICGDGKNMGQAECDDGNSDNGDGCSSNCEIEFGWECSGGSKSSPDTCKDEISPFPILEYLSQSDSGCVLTLSFSEAVTVNKDMSEIIEINIEGITEFSWSISLENSIYIITLEIYENIAKATNVTINFSDPKLIVDMRGNEMVENFAKTNLMHSFIYQLEGKMKTYIAIIVIFTIVMILICSTVSGFIGGKFNIQSFWGMIEMMQLQYFLIFLSIKYPGNLFSYISAFSISNGNFLPNPFQKYLAENSLYSDLPEKYPNDLFVGEWLCVSLIILIGLPTSLLAFKLYPRFSIVKWLKKYYLFSIPLRFGIISFLEVTLLVFLQWKEIFEQDINSISLVLAIISTTYIILTFVLIIWQVTQKSELELSAKQHKIKFGTLYEAFKRRSKLKVSFILFQNTRRVLLVSFYVFLYDFAALQVGLSAGLSLLYIISLAILTPFNAKIPGNYLNLASEIMYFLASCFLLKLTDDTMSSNNRKTLGWIITALLCFSIFLHIITIFITQILNLAKAFKHLKEKLKEGPSQDSVSIEINNENELKIGKENSLNSINSNDNYINSDEESYSLVAKNEISINEIESINTE